jgi:hypothetical protein
LIPSTRLYGRRVFERRARIGKQRDPVPSCRDLAIRSTSLKCLC